MNCILSVCISGEVHLSVFEASLVLWNHPLLATSAAVHSYFQIHPYEEEDLVEPKTNIGVILHVHLKGTADVHTFYVHTV